MRPVRFALLLAPAVMAASVPEQPQAPSLDDQLRVARAEQATAEKEAATLEHAAASARSEADRLRSEEAAAAQSVEAAEARITAADAQLSIAAAYVAAHRERLAEEQAPISSLLAGLATMSSRPPLLAIADQRSADELVKVRILLDATLPVIRARTARLSLQLGEGQRLERAAEAARAELAASDRNLTAKRQQFASLEQEALQRAEASTGEALSAGDVALSAGENVEQLSGARAGDRSAMALALQLEALDPAPDSPAPGGPIAQTPIAYELPATAQVTEGLDEVNSSGVRSRGLTLATAKGSPVLAPAAGVVRFAGPYRDYDGVLIIDHGGGWMSLLVNVSTDLKPGEKVGLGDPVGRALGPLEVELSRSGRRISPALIAGSSQSLSKDYKGR